MKDRDANRLWNVGHELLCVCFHSSLCTFSQTERQNQQVIHTGPPTENNERNNNLNTMGNTDTTVASSEGQVADDVEAQHHQQVPKASNDDAYGDFETPPEPDEVKQKRETAEHSLSSSLHRVQMGPPIPVTYVATKNPKDTLKAVYKAGIYKAGLSLDLLCVQSFMAGIFIAMASQLYLAIGGGVLGACFFPTGLIAVVLTSGELFTGDSLVFIASVLGGKVHIKYLLRNWTVAWIMNFVGCLAWASVLAYGSTALEDAGAEELAISVALKKAYQPWWSIFAKGIGANFMVRRGELLLVEQCAHCCRRLVALWNRTTNPAASVACFDVDASVLQGLHWSVAGNMCRRGGGQDTGALLPHFGICYYGT